MSEILARLGRGVASFDPADWDRCAGTDDPFLSHAFLSALEESGSATRADRLAAVPIAIDGEDGRPAALMPAYVKSHSQGEYVFDHMAGRRLGSGPAATIIPSSRSPCRSRRCRAAGCSPTRGPCAGLIAAAEAVVRQHGLSSAHATFIAEEEVPLFERAGWLIRVDSQFHWHNHGYVSFEDFLAALSSRKRKAIRRERAAALEGLEVEHLTGAAIAEAHWDAFWAFYQDTGSRKWGRPYLTRKLLLAARRADGGPGAAHLRAARRAADRRSAQPDRRPTRSTAAIGARPRRCRTSISRFAIIRRSRRRSSAASQRVEAGAQGPHKLSRGYAPVPTWSAHFIPDPGFREAVADFLAAERRAVAREIGALAEMTPFRKG
jgi:predicted N-acyltransferase